MIAVRSGHTLTLLVRRHGPWCAIGLHSSGHAGLTPVSPQPMLGPSGEAPDCRERRSYMSVTPAKTRRGTRPVDFVNVGSLLSEEEKEIRGRVRSFVDEHVIPAAAGYWDRAEFPFDLLPGLGRLGIMGGTFGEEYGCAGWNNVAYGLAIAELARGSGSLSTFLHVQSGLAMTAIHELGSEEHRQRWLPAMARCEKIGAFALTEPGAGSDPGSMTTTAVAEEGGYVLNGEKRWIG